MSGHGESKRKSLTVQARTVGMDTGREAPVASGSGVVMAVAGVLVTVAAVFGLLLGAVILPARVSGPLPEAVVGPLTFEITPVTMAVYGVVMVGTVLLVGIVLVRAVSAYRLAE
jgi:multidrug efflux pump subunit AcrB